MEHSKNHFDSFHTIIICDIRQYINDNFYRE